MIALRDEPSPYETTEAPGARRRRPTPRRAPAIAADPSPGDQIASASGLSAATRGHSPPAAPGAQQPPFTEAQLTALWRGQRFPEGALVTRRGVPVNVIFQGRPGRGPGPDFRDAVIAGPSGVPLRGDVELHVRASSFRAHGHATDAAYANVILHVVFEDDSAAGETALPGGGSAPIVALADWVARRAGELERWIERPLLWREPCHDALMRLGAGGAAAALESEGDRRIDAKAALMAETIRAGGIEQALYEGLLEALGYGGNGPPMLALARLLPWRKLRGLVRDQPGAFEPLLLGSAGLLPAQRSLPQRPHRGPLHPHVAALERDFAGRRLPALSPGIWKRWGVRPENAAPRRVAAAASLLAALGRPRALLRSLDAATVNEAVGGLTSARATGFWAHHYDPCADPCRLPPAYVGRARAIEIITNVVVPAAIASGEDSLAARARALYARLPRPAAYGVTRFVESALTSEGVRLPINARRAQGLLALHRDWCTKGGCGRCPLSEL